MDSHQEMVTTKNGKEIPKHCLCRYCGNDARDNLVSRKIRVNRQWKEMRKIKIRATLRKVCVNIVCNVCVCMYVCVCVNINTYLCECV